MAEVLEAIQLAEGLAAMARQGGEGAVRQSDNRR